MNKLRLIFVLGVIAVSAALVAATAGAKPSGFAPDTGSYSGVATVKGKKSDATAKVTQKGPGYAVLVGVGEPAECFDAALGGSLPIAVSYEFTAPLDGQSIDYKGTGKSLTGQIGNKTVAVKVDGHFTATDAFVATVTPTISAEGGNPNSTSCTAPTLNLKFKKN